MLELCLTHHALTKVFESLSLFFSVDPAIGFEFGSYTFEELQTDSSQVIRLVKETVSVLQLSVVVSVLAGTPSGAQPASINSDYRLLGNLVYQFPPDTTMQTISLDILADMGVEETEGFILGVEQAPSSPVVVRGQFPQTNVFIIDSDGE